MYQLMIPMSIEDCFTFMKDIFLPVTNHLYLPSTFVVLNTALKQFKTE